MLCSNFIQKFILKIRSKYDLFRITVLRDCTFLDAEDLYMCSLFPKKVIYEILNVFHPKTILDIGCGTGVSLKYFLNQNIDATGVENSKLAIKQSNIANKIIRHNLKKKLDLKKKFDLV